MPNIEQESEVDQDRPWEELASHISENAGASATDLLEQLNPEGRRRALSRLSEGEQTNLLEILEPDKAAELLENLPEAQAADIMEAITPEAAADILEQMSETEGADLLREMSGSNSAAVLAEVDDAKEAEHLRELTSYAWDTAGGLMTESYAAFAETSLVGDVLRELSENAERYADMDVQYVYVLGGSGQLHGVLRLRDLVLTSPSINVAKIMIEKPYSVNVNHDFETLAHLFDERAFLGLPVVDDAGHLKGVVTREAVREAINEHRTEDYLHASGIVGGEELRSMPILARSGRRLAWLMPNIVLNLAAATIIAMYEETLQAVIALAVFLPIVSDMSGCSGNQAVAVSIRELALGLIRPNEFLRIAWKEGVVGIINGIVLGVLLGFVAYLWKGNIWLGLVIGSALTLNTILSVTLGGLVPLLLKRMKVDPALASGPILTTCTDMCGFFLVLGLAQKVLSRLI